MQEGSVCTVVTTDASLVLPTIGHKTREFVNQTGIILEKDAPHPESLSTKPWYIVFIQGSTFSIREDALKEVPNEL